MLEHPPVHRTLCIHRAYLRAFGFSSDGRKLASADNKGVLCLWDVESGHLQSRVQTEPGLAGASCEALAFSPENELFVSESTGLTVRDGTSLLVIRKSTTMRPKTLQFGGGGAWFLTDDTVYDTRTLNYMASAPRRLATEFFDYPYRCAQSDGDSVLVCDDGGYEDVGLATEGPLFDARLTLFDRRFSAERRTRVIPKNSDSGVTALGYDAQTRQFIVGWWGGTIEAWAADGTRETVLTRIWSTVRVFFCGTGFTAAVADAGAEKLEVGPYRLLRWDGCFSGEPESFDVPREDVVLSPNGRWLAIPQRSTPSGEFPLAIHDLGKSLRLEP
jgi:WD40 repeat protein